MKPIFEIDGQDAKDWVDWLASKPPEIRAMAERWPPNYLYRLGECNVAIVAYSEDGTVRVNIWQHYNPDRLLVMERSVFGVDPAMLIPVDCPELLVGKIYQSFA